MCEIIKLYARIFPYEDYLFSENTVKIFNHRLYSYSQKILFHVKWYKWIHTHLQLFKASVDRIFSAYGLIYSKKGIGKVLINLLDW